MLLSGSGLTTAINLIYNVVLARFLGPQGFGHATVVYTILTLISAITLSFQIISAKSVAKQSSAETKYAVYRGFHRAAWAVGVVIGLSLLTLQWAIGRYLNLPSPSLVAILAIGAVFYVPLGCRRGFIQGSYSFKGLAGSLVLEGIVRLAGSLILIWAGFGVVGVIAANAAAIAAAYFAAAPKVTALVENPLRLQFAVKEIYLAIVFFAGQVLINNSDIVLVKHFFSAQDAGLYAAVAMVGRVVFSFSNAVVNSMFPLAAGTPNDGRNHMKIVGTSLLLVLGSGSLLALALSVTPSSIWRLLFGPGFVAPGRFDLRYLLTLYAITTIVYSLSVVIIAFEMSYKIANTSWVQLAISGILIASLCRFHSSLRQVILVQLVLMVALLIAVATPFFVDIMQRRREHNRLSGSAVVRLLRRATEDEVIAEILMSDFGTDSFKNYQETMGNLVRTPDLLDVDENAKRRALFLLRHLPLWREIPDGTDWYEVEIFPDHMEHIKVFPRAQWRTLGIAGFCITKVVDAIRMPSESVDPSFLRKVDAIGNQFRQQDPGFNAVVLIGLDEHGPLTILDGNHRLVAALLHPVGEIQKLRFLCGLSPRMKQCCWYRTNLMTLSRYGLNILLRTINDPRPKMKQYLKDSQNVCKPSSSGQFSGELPEVMMEAKK